MEIHRKPGYDPAELFFDPADRFARARATLALARKALGMRYTMSVVPLDPTVVRGTHAGSPTMPAKGRPSSAPTPACDATASPPPR